MPPARRPGQATADPYAQAADAQRVLRAAASMLPHESPNAHGRRYLLPCHLLYYGGIYEYVTIDVPQARQWLLAGPVMSFISHPFLHAAFEELIGFLTPPGTKEPLPALGYQDDALVFWIENYAMLGLESRGNSRKVRELMQDCGYNLGLLRRLA